MKTVKRKVRLFLDASAIRSVTDQDVYVYASQVRPGWAPELMDNQLRSVVEVELSVPVSIQEEELPPAVAIEIGSAGEKEARKA